MTSELASRLARAWAGPFVGMTAGMTGTIAEADYQALLAWVRIFVILVWGESMAKRGSCSPPNEILAPVLGIGKPQARALWEESMEGHWPPLLDEEADQ